MAELKPCPFCGGNAEIYTGRNFPARGKNVCESEAEAQEKLEEYTVTHWMPLPEPPKEG